MLINRAIICCASAYSAKLSMHYALTLWKLNSCCIGIVFNNWSSSIIPRVVNQVFMNRPIFPRAIIVYLWLDRQPSLLIVCKSLCIKHLIMVLACIYELSEVQRTHSSRHFLLFEWRVLFWKIFTVSSVSKADSSSQRNCVLPTNIWHWRY